MDPEADMCYELHTFHGLGEARHWLVKQGFSHLASRKTAEIWSDGENTAHLRDIDTKTPRAEIR